MAANMELSSGKLLEFISEIYHAGHTGQWQPVLNKLLDITQSNKAFFILHELGNQQPLIMELQANFEYCQSALLDYQSRPFTCPTYQITKHLTAGESTNANKHIDLTLHRNSNFFQDIYSPLKVFHSVVGVLCRDEHYDSIIVVNRDECDQPYQDNDEELFRLITPHFSRAMRIFIDLRLYKNQSYMSQSALDQLDKAYIICDENGQVLIANAFANKKLNAKCPVTLVANKLFIKNPVYQQRLLSCIRQCANRHYTDISEHETFAIQGSNDEHILFTIIPLKNKNTFSDIDVPCCTVTISFQQQRDWLKVKDFFLLTPKEMRLLKALYAKKKLIDLPTVFHVSYNTLRTQLQAIFKKLEVSSQSELMIKLNLFT
jgi:DNA-binding CsgD family transcriptional regulator